MATYRSRKTIEATQWNAPGDHPFVEAQFPTLGRSGDVVCYSCNRPRKEHGWAHSALVCPGSYIVELQLRQIKIVPRGQFEAEYELEIRRKMSEAEADALAAEMNARTEANP